MRIAFAVLIIGLMSLVAVAQTTAPAGETLPETVRVERGHISTTVDIDGFFEPTESFEVRLRPKSYQGDLTVSEAVTPGSRVEKGSSLLSIDPTPLQKQLAAAENDLATARANLAKAEADVQIGEAGDTLAMKIQQTELSNAEAGLNWWERVDGAHMLKNAELSVKAARDSVEDQGDELEQLRKMYKSEELTSATADIVVKRALRGLERTKINQGMQESRETKVKDFDYTVARQKLVFAIEQQRQQLAELTAKHQQQSAVRKTSLASAQAAEERAQQKVGDLKTDLESFEVTAPFDGVAFVGEFVQGRWKDPNPKLLRPDEKLPAGQTVMTIVPEGKLRLVLEVPEAKLSTIEPGLTVRVLPMGLPDAVTEGTTAAPAAAGVYREREQYFHTPVTLSKVHPRLAPGQRATARFDVQAEDVLLVPAGAVSKGRVQVRTADDAFEWRDVVIGYSDGEMTEIRDGLREGDVVRAEAGK